MAAKLHIVATILEYLESPEHAITLCQSFLKELHGLGEIAEIFSVYLKRGLMSRWNKAKRVECVKSVMLINYTLFQFASKFSRECISVIAWPCIELDERSFNPILNWQEVSTRNSMGDELTQPTANRLILDENEKDIIPFQSAVNSHGDVLVENRSNCDIIKVMLKTGKSRVVNLPVPGESEVRARGIKGLAVDKNNNVYVVSPIFTDSSRQNGYYVLDVLDEKYNVKQRSRKLEYLKKTTGLLYDVKIAITKNNYIVMMQHDNPHVFVCDNTGKLKHVFEPGSSYVRGLGISRQDEIMIASYDRKSIQMYSEEGIQKSSIKLPEGYIAHSLTFSYANCRIIVFTFVKDSFFLLSYTESAGELESKMFLCKKIESEFYPEIFSHPSGPCVIVWNKSITFV